METKELDTKKLAVLTASLLLLDLEKRGHCVCLFTVTGEGREAAMVAIAAGVPCPPEMVQDIARHMFTMGHAFGRANAEAIAAISLALGGPPTITVDINADAFRSALH